MSENSNANCPVCGKVFPSSFINTHVNECLNISSSDSEKNTPLTNPNKRKIDENSRTKQAWGFLHKSGTSSTGSSSTSKTTPNSSSKKIKLSVSLNAPTQTVSATEKYNSESDDDILLQDSNISTGSGRIEKSLPTMERQSLNTLCKVSKATSLKITLSQAGVGGPANASTKKQFAPLAERMRPSRLEEYVGQEKAVGKRSLLYSLLQADHIPSMVLWGPPGCGKTTLARIIANNCKRRTNIKFVQLSATTSGVNDVKQMVTIAKNDQKMFKRKTILFLDEVHRFNKVQQDSLLPHVEDGTITLIGATTENPSFQVTSALLSRCRVIVLDKLSAEEVSRIVVLAATELGARIAETLEDVVEPQARNGESEIGSIVWVTRDAVTTLANLCDGDARAAINGLQMAVQSRISATQTSGENQTEAVIVGKEHISEGLQRSHVVYDRAGEEHYNIISAMHKSIRGSDASAALYWMARMLEGGENPLYIARRLIRIASEDIGLADPSALSQAVAAHQACHFVGMPECDVTLAQCCVYMARAPKSVEVYHAYKNARACVREHQGPLPSVPLHLRNASTKLMKDLGYGKGYKYNPDHEEPVDQDYFPEELIGKDFFT